MEEERRTTAGEASRDSSASLVDHWLTAAALIAATAVLSWPFFIAPRQFLYIRYFDADTIFGPAWKLHDLINVWSSQLHLGYTHARDLSYVSIQELISVAMAPLGADLRNRSSLIAVSLLIFFAFWIFARIHFPRVPGWAAVVAGLFYGANPFVVAFIHDGYSGLLLDYALLPVSLLVVNRARQAGKPVLLSLVPVLFLITGMYNLTSVIVALIGTIILEYRYIVGALRASGLTAIAVALAFALNIYWVLPLAYDLATHPAQPIRAESAGDIAALTSAGTLTNTLLLRSYPEIWTKAYGTRECTGCTFYESPWFVLAMLTLVALALIGLVRARRWGVLFALVASIVVATGYHYQSEIIGIPYVVMMSLPTFDIFRSSVKFSALTAMFYSLGLLYFFSTGVPAAQRVVGRYGRTANALKSSGIALTVLIVAVPYISGSMIEHSPDKPPHFPNFVVTIPSYYADLYKHRDLLTEDSATLLLPNTPLAAYAWGAYGNELIPPYLGKPILYVSYLPQPNWMLERTLQVLTRQETAPTVRSAILSTLGIRRSLYRDDASETKPLPLQPFGKEIARFGGLHVLDNAPAFPPFFTTTTIDPVVGVGAIATYAGLYRRAARGFDAEADTPNVCSGRVALGIEPTRMRHRGRLILAIPIGCKSPMTVSLLASNGRLTAWTMPPGPHRYTLRSNRKDPSILAILSRRGVRLQSSQNSILPAHAKQYGWLGFSFDPMPYTHYTVFNQSFDPSWQGIVRKNGHWKPISNFMIDGFANAWSVPANAPLVIINVLQIFTWIGALIMILVLVAYLYVFRLAFQTVTQ